MDNNPPVSSGQEGKFFNGFLLGLLVGAVVVFLLGTKKGKQLLKAISEEGIDNISNILDEANKSVELDKIAEEPSLATEEKSIEEKPKVRRFFRGVSRHVN